MATEVRFLQAPHSDAIVTQVDHWCGLLDPELTSSWIVLVKLHRSRYRVAVCVRGGYEGRSGEEHPIARVAVDRAFVRLGEALIGRHAFRSPAFAPPLGSDARVRAH